MRKTGALLLAAMLCLALCGCARWWELLPQRDKSVSVSAVGTPAVTVTVEGGAAEVGDTVILPVTVSADAHLVNADVFLRYDPALVEPVLQYDAATDSEHYAEPGVFAGTVRSEKTEDGTLYVLLASADEGTAQKSTLFYVAFRLLSDEANGATITPEIPICHVCVGDGDQDAVAAGAVTAKKGVLTVKAATDTTATAAADILSEE